MAADPLAAPPAPPASDFFSAQDAARWRARRWLVVFAGCVVAVVGVMVVYVALVSTWVTLAQSRDTLPWEEALLAAPRDLMLGTAVVTLLMVIRGTWTRAQELQHGSDTLALSIGARAVSASGLPPAEKQLRNVVEEMALAAGGLPPALYVLDGERAINAFSGTSAREPFLVVTRGAVDGLQRDELQALVAYGIGQQRNGDATLNLRLVSWLAGLTVITALGRALLRAPAFVLRRGESGESVGDFGKAMLFFSLPIAVAGGVVMLIGAVGGVLARFVRALASRQRIYLADATAVQYTRDPVAVRDLLRRVEAEPDGGTLSAAYAEEFGPMLFVPGVRRLCLRTHPKVRQRIARLEQPVT